MTSTLLRLLAFAFVTATSQVALADLDSESTKIAVLTLKGDGIESSITSALTDVVAIEVDKFPGIDVTTDSDLIARLDRMALEQLLGCVDSGCQVDLQQEVVVDKLLFGQLAKLDSRYVITLHMVDRLTGKPEGRVSQSLVSQQSRLIAAIQTATYNLMAKITKTEGAGELSVDTLESVRTAQLNRVYDLSLQVGSTLYIDLSGQGRLSEPGLHARAGLQYNLADGLYLGAVAYGETTRSNYSQMLLVGDFSTSAVEPAELQYSFETVLRSAGAMLTAQYRRQYGLVLPFVGVALGPSFVELQVGDAYYDSEDPSNTSSIALATGGKVRDQEGQTAIGLNVEMNAGAALVLSESFGLQLSVHVFKNFVGIEETRQWAIGVGADEVETMPFQSIQGIIFSVAPLLFNLGI